MQCTTPSLPRMLLLAWNLVLVAVARMPAPADAAISKKFNIVMILVDDLGHGGLESNNPLVKGPRVSELRDEGLYLSRHYVYKFCSPTRGSFLSSRYPFRTGNTRSNFIPWSRPDGLDLGFDTLPLRLKRLGYSNHHVGKWHLGFHNESYMPTGRGFDSFFGYLSGMQDHFTQELGAMIGCKQVVDLTYGAQPAHSKNGTYSGWLYNAEAVAVVNTAPEPFFLNYWLQNTHAPFEVPTQYSDLYKFPGNEKLEVFNGMVSVVDSAVGNVTAALKKRPGTWLNTLLIYTHDNGAPLGGGGSNFPFRGGKNSNFEGGTRVPAIVAGGALPPSRRGQQLSTLIHVCDWLPTILSALQGGGDVPPLTDSVSATIPYDGLNQWDLITGDRLDTQPVRTEIILDHCLANFSTAGTGCNHFGVDYAVGAIIQGDWKLVKGPNGGEWTNFSNGTMSSSFGGRACDDHCLFNLTADESEQHDLSAAEPGVLKNMLARFQELTASYHPPKANPAADDASCCAAAVARGNFLGPWNVSAPPTPPPPLGPCIGHAGDPGWEIRNNTGGGGPAVDVFPASGLGEADVEACRKRCCATDYCVSIVLHLANGQYKCYLNPQECEGGCKEPYARPETLMAFVKRGSTTAT